MLYMEQRIAVFFSISLKSSQRNQDGTRKVIIRKVIISKVIIEKVIKPSHLSVSNKGLAPLTASSSLCLAFLNNVEGEAYLPLYWLLPVAHLRRLIYN